MKNEKFADSILLPETNQVFLERIAIAFGVLVFFGFCYWSIATSLDEVAVATGSISPARKIPVVQHAEGGKVEKFFVKEGDFVEKNQPLVRFSQSQIRDDLRLTRIKLRTAIARRLSLIKEYRAKSQLASRGLYSRLALHNLFRTLKSTEGQIAELRASLSRHKRQSEEKYLRAPISGEIFNLKLSAEGNVFKPGETILEMMPKETSLLAEIQINPTDIGYIKKGQSVTLKFSAYDFAKFGGMNANLTEISPTTVLTPSGEVAYVGKVSIPNRYLNQERQEMPILAGMTLTADIHIGSKTIMEYLLKPIFKSADLALRER